MKKEMPIASVIKKPGVLRKTVGVKKGEKAPEKVLKNAEKSKKPKTKNDTFVGDIIGKISAWFSKKAK